ncbi:MAG: hypothetical protein KGI33_02300 [Thaumarchaeota archaeon]|nr:hypothetical protein [Nitrososphaerota archaeon]
MTEGSKYRKLTVEGEIATKWICGCFETADGFFKFCKTHNNAMKRTIEAQIDELDMTLVVDDKNSAG